MRRLWKIHSWMGLFAGLGLLVVGLTGSLLVFHGELDSLFHPRLMRVEERGERMPFDSLAEKLRQAVPGFSLSGWPLEKKEGFSDRIWLKENASGEWKAVYLNPYAGTLLSLPGDSAETLGRRLLSLHYSFFLRDFGVVLAGLFAVLLCLLGLSGVWLYRNFWKHFFALRWNKSWRIFFSDLHKAVGISSVLFNLILGFTGAWWNLPAVTRLFSKQESPPAKTESAPTLYNETLSVEALMREAPAHLPGFETTYVSFPESPESPCFLLYGSVPTKNPLRSEYGSTVSFDASTGAFKELKDIRKAPLWEQIEDTFAPLHFGTFGGLPVKILWALFGLAPGLLAVTGSVMWWKRRGMERKRATSA